MTSNPLRAPYSLLPGTSPEEADFRLNQLLAEFTILRDGYRDRADLMEAHANVLNELGDQTVNVETTLRELDDDMRRRLRSIGSFDSHETSFNPVAAFLRNMENSYRRKANEYRKLAGQYDESRLKALGAVMTREELESEGIGNV